MIHSSITDKRNDTYLSKDMPQRGQKKKSAGVAKINSNKRKRKLECVTH